MKYEVWIMGKNLVLLTESSQPISLSEPNYFYFSKLFINMKDDRLNMESPLKRYTIEEIQHMPTDEFLNLLEEDNEYVRRKHNTLKREKRPKFNSIEELRIFYHCRPLDEAISDLDKLFLD